MKREAKVKFQVYRNDNISNEKNIWNGSIRDIVNSFDHTLIFDDF